VRRLLQLQQALEQTGPEHTVQCMEEQLQQGPAGGFLEGLVGELQLGVGYSPGLETTSLATPTDSMFSPTWTQSNKPPRTRH
jgi:hypothetical protein